MQSFDPYANGHADYLQSMMNFIDMHSSRISTLTLDLGTAHTVASKDKSWSTKMSLPSLESLKINAPPSTRLEHFYENWSVPSLLHLHGRNCMPQLPPDVLSKIKSFSFEVEEYDSWNDNRVRWSLTELASYLGKLLSVEEVSLDFDCDQVHYRTMMEALPILIPKVKLEKLRSLSIKIQEYDYSCRYAAIVFLMFDYENLESLAIDLPSAALPNLSSLFYCTKWASRCCRLRNLDFRIRPAYCIPSYDHGESPRNKILSSFLGKDSMLENFYIECAGDDRQVFGFSNRLAALQLKNCQLFGKTRENSASPDIMYDLEEVFRRRGDPVDECLVLDGAISSPLDEAKLIKVPISNRVRISL